ncbi:hypothetical protein K8R30_01945 [archaeon]|nr:hypothetical protein [archaeon]
MVSSKILDKNLKVREGLGFRIGVVSFGLMALLGIVGSQALLDKNKASRIKKEQIHYKLSLEAIGLSSKEVLKADRTLDINRDGVSDYIIAIPRKDGSYAQRFVLGYNPSQNKNRP